MKYYVEIKSAVVLFKYLVYKNAICKANMTKTATYRRRNKFTQPIKGLLL